MLRIMKMIIVKGEYELSDMISRIDEMYIKGKISMAEMDELTEGDLAEIQMAIDAQYVDQDTLEENSEI